MMLPPALYAKVKALKRDAWALTLALRDPRTPWYTRALVILIAAYLLSPIDLIPDFIPVLGLLDELVLLPVAIALAIRLMPAEVFAEARARVQAGEIARKPVMRWGALIIVAIWLVVLVSAGWLLREPMQQLWSDMRAAG